MLIHVVCAGETLSGIAALYGISLSRLLQDNGLTGEDKLVVGQALIIMLPSSVYTVRRGDTLNSIASRNGITVMELLQNNPSLIFNRNLHVDRQLAIAFRGGKMRMVAVNGYAYPSINREILLRALPYITYLSVFSYGFTESGEITPPENDDFLINQAYAYKAAPIMVLTTIGENGNFSSEKAAALLNDKVYQNTVLDRIVAFMKKKGFLGLDIDFEYIMPEDADNYISFLDNARARMDANGFLLSAALASKTSSTQRGLLYEAHDYPAIGEKTDTVFLMTYEWGYAYGPPLAVAPLNQVRNVVNYAVTEIPPRKLQLGIPNYAYDWTLPYEKGASRAMTIGNSEAVEIAARNNAEIRFDETAASPFFEYTAGGSSHIIWFEDVRSVKTKLELADEYMLGGIGYWNLMRPFAQNWSLLAARYDIIKIV